MTENETLLDKAKSNLFQAKILFRYRTEDESIINGVAYHLQQTVELALKHHLEMMGVEYSKTHDIEVLLHQLDDSFFPELYPWAGTITLMEAKTRYIKNYRASLRTVENVFPLSEKLIQYIEMIESEALGDEEKSD